MRENFISSTVQQFQYYKLLGEKTFDQLSDNQLFEQPNEASNSVSVMVKHLSGNMLSRWTDFLNTDGEKEWRNRDGEFEDTIETRNELVAIWDKGWSCLFDALAQVNDDNFDQLVYIRNQGHTIVEAVLRQLAHYSYHVGQIVYLGRMLRNEEWTSLSIPKGNSVDYNQKKFAEPKRKEHFTSEYIENKDQE